MRRTLLLVSVITFVSAGVPPQAQAPGTFTGSWSLAPHTPADRNGQPAPAPGYGPQISITQVGDTVTISRLAGGQTVHVVHPLDGSESRSRTPGRLCQGDAQATWRATRDNNTIETIQVASIPPGASMPTPMNVRTTFTLSTPDTLIVTVTVQNPSMPGPQTRTATYRRSAQVGDVIPTPKAPPVEARIGQVEWLGGTWIGTSPTSTFEERWTPPAGGSMLAVARSLRNGVMTGFEFLCIVERNGGLVYQAMPNGRQPATDFTLTALTAQRLRFENPAHDFPKVIEYTLQADGTLEAVVSGTATQKPQTFRFKRQ